MKAKTISKTIKKKMDEWLDSIEDEALVNSLKRNIIVTGGCITSMFLQEKVNDFDVYLKKPVTAYYLAKYYAIKMLETVPADIKLRLTLKHRETGENYGEPYARALGKQEYKIYPQEDGTFHLIIDPYAVLTEHVVNSILRTEVFVKSAGVTGENGENGKYKYFENDPEQAGGEYIETVTKEDTEKKEKYRPVFMSSNAITLSNKVQVVLRFTGDTDEIHHNYDFKHATNYWTYGEGLVTNAKALECILARELQYMGSVYPLASIFRARKFIQRGWSMHIGNYVKMALQLNELDLFDEKVLEDQLTGVDMAYMYEVIHAVRTKREETPNFQFNATYLCEIVDRLMGEKQDEHQS